VDCRDWARYCLVTVALAVALISGPTVRASDADPVGVVLLRQVDASLTGSGVRVAQPEAGYPAWEVNPAAVPQPASLFSFIGSNGTVTGIYPNAGGSESGHADSVGSIFYGSAAGLSPGVSHVDNYDANYFINVVVASRAPVLAKIVNQSFIFPGGTVADQQASDLDYDYIAAQSNILFVSGAGNGGAVYPPSTSYNGLSVAAYGVGSASSVGPTADNGRAKPDLTAPAPVTSASTPMVSGAAALLVQAGARGDGGAGTSTAAVDIRTVKALLLNGAIKPADWTRLGASPLDARYGAGVVNVFNSWAQLSGGRHSAIETTSASLGAAHPPGANAGNISTGSGWDMASITTSVSTDKVNHYYFNFTSVGSNSLTATLVWNRAAGQSSLNNLDLFLYDTRDGRLVASSISTVDNVEHIYIPAFSPGRYDLQVFKKGGAGVVSNTETYALAFETFSMALRVASGPGGTTLTWPLAPTGFTLETSTNLAGTSWSAVTGAASVVSGQNSVAVPASAGPAFFRLRRP
jgi:hypothetical protein